MTRQKKELLKKICEIEKFIFADMELGCGCAPADFYKELYEEMYKYEDELARLSHFSSAERMMWDVQGELVDLR